MGKNKSSKNDKNGDKSSAIESVSATGKVKKTSKQQPIDEKLSAVIKSVNLPTNAEGLTADQLTENQKHVLKKVCTKMYGHQHSERQKMPAKSIESATAQLADRLKQQLAQRKKDKKNKKAT